MSHRGFALPIFIVLIALLLVAGIGIGVYLLQNPQILKSRASTSPSVWLEAFEITDGLNKPVVCDSSKEVPVCNVSTVSVNFRLKDLNILQQNVLGEHTEEATDSATATPSATVRPTLSPTPAAKKAGVKIDDKDLDLQNKTPLKVLLIKDASKVNTPAKIDLPVVINLTDNALRAYVITFNYTPAKNTNPEATGSSKTTDLNKENKEASASPKAQSTPPARTTGTTSATPAPSASATPNRYDLNQDQVIDRLDLTEFIRRYQAKSYSTIDLNRDGRVNSIDYSELQKQISN